MNITERSSSCLVGRISVLLAALLAAPGGLAAQEERPQDEVPPQEVEREVEIVKARLPGPPGNRHVRAVRKLRPGGGRVGWSRQGDWIAFDQADERGVYDIHLLNVETGAERCLTCDQYELRKIHSLSPVWHPSGDYLVFQVQDRPRRVRLDTLQLTTPHRGLHGDLWTITRDGKHAWQLTQISQNGGAVVDPHFSHEADQLAWSERVVSRSGRWGEWAFRVAEFRIKRGLPRLGKVRTFQPDVPKGFVNAHAFTPNDRGLLLSAGEAGRDLLRLDLESGLTEALVATPEYRDDVVSVAPRGDRLVWVSDRSIPRPPRPRLPYRGDLWFRSELDRRQERLTFFNDPESDHALGEALIDDLAWSPLGDRLAIHVVYPARGGAPAGEDGPAVEEAIYLVELDETFAR